MPHVLVKSKYSKWKRVVVWVLSSIAIHRAVIDSKRRNGTHNCFRISSELHRRRFGHILSKSIDNQLYLICWSAWLHCNRWKMSYAEHLLGSIFCLDHLHDFQLVCGRDGQRYCCFEIPSICIFFVESIFLISRINVHRNVIEAACTKFYSMAQNDSLRSEIILHDVNGELMQTTIDFIYSGHIELSLSNARDIIYVASVLGIISLEEKCAQFLITNLSLDNCLATMTTAVNCNKFDLFAKSWKLMCEGFGHLPFLNLTLLSNSNQIGNNSNVNAVEDVISCHMMQCFKLMESDHLQHIPHALESIRLKHIPSNVNTLKHSPT